MVMKVLEDERMPESMLKSVIVLLYKKDDKRELKNWRPISLLNVDYKVVAKVLANRLRAVVEKLVGEEQVCAVPGRSIAESLVSLRDVIWLCKERKQEVAVLAVDFEKAYDRVSHEFMFKVLRRMGIPEVLIGWIKCLYRGMDVDEEFGFFQEGDFIIGGVFTIRAATTNFMGSKSYVKLFDCVDDDFRALLNVLVFRFAIHKVNQNTEILPNITLGYHITDSCLDAGVAVRNVLQILSGPQKLVPNYSCSGEGKLVGFIGDHYSMTTISMAQLLGIYRYTQISYGATDPSLTDRRLYPHVFRTVQNDHIHYLAVIELLKHFGWTWVGIFTTDDDAGDKEKYILTKYMISHGICVEFTFKLGIETITDDMTFKALEESAAILKNSTSKVIVVCGSYVYINAVFTLFDSLASEKTFIFPPIWVSRSSVHLLPLTTINGSLAVELYPLFLPDKEHFFDGIDKMNSTNNSPGSWYFLTIAKCLSANRGKSKIVCETAPMQVERFPNMDGFVNQGVTPRIYYAVENLAKALHNMQLFPKGKSDDRRHHYYKHQLYSLLKEIKYSFESAEPVPFFNEYGEFVYHYRITNWILGNNYTAVYKEVGNFTPWAPEGQKLHVNPEAITWKRTNKVPVSRCSGPCLPGNRKKFGTSIHKCCYECVPCPEGEISNISDSENCMKCPDDEWPNEKKDQCFPKLVEFLSYTDDPISAVFSAVSILCCLLNGLILGIFIHYQDTPIVKANNRNLSYLLLVAIMLSFLCVFLFLGRPVDVTCMLRVTSFGVIFSVAVSSLLAKSIMVCIAFNATKPGSCWRKWIGAKLPNSIMSVCSLIQVIICVAWLSISPPFQDEDFHTYQGKIIIQCNEGSVIGFYSVLGYMGLLAAVSFIIAFLARTLPDSFNEAKYITFSMLVFCSVWIAMIPAYLSTKGKYMVAVEIFAIWASSAGLLGCIFFPKCYIILFRPDLNTKTGLLRNNMK
ncbi:vomeronasal type-2 receptor 26-like [Rana temporaria]|uniref:vomeronasal type-2 receptor 26-like n=1 Tax=Rana temporaria TaxID=8407 RepID=UPI001AAD1306|nr:vomeronasal type-2 receptor 26-like [Rana temporaria]